MKTNLKVTLATIAILVAGSTVYLSITSSISSSECLEIAQRKCPDGIKTYKHISSTWSDDVCECECKQFFFYLDYASTMLSDHRQAGLEAIVINCSSLLKVFYDGFIFTRRSMQY
ncbi:MAG: hypothetical protein WBG46_09035 [Nonlabens sp.]